MRREISIVRLYVLRVTYLLVGVGLGVEIWPLILRSATVPPAHMQGVVRAMLTAVSLLALLGVRYPLQLLPLLLFEFIWKAVWVLAIGVPLWRAGRLDPATTGDTWTTCLGSLVLFVLAIPWGYVLRNYVQARGDRWRDVVVPEAAEARAGVVTPAP
ncbi:MAG TPA: hypothetical protein VGP25_13840 [Gemmatimonadaceae bacterium]|jgi:hypothetical protein|nr:hypothetical protein [Gemmatimonadaceae bacterium]